MIGPMTAARFVEHSRIERARKGRPRAPRKPRVRTADQIAATAKRQAAAAERREKLAEKKLAVIQKRARGLVTCEENATKRCARVYGPRQARGPRQCVLHHPTKHHRNGKRVCLRWGKGALLGPPGM